MKKTVILSQLEQLMEGKKYRIRKAGFQFLICWLFEDKILISKTFLAKMTFLSVGKLLKNND